MFVVDFTSHDQVSTTTRIAQGSDRLSNVGSKDMHRFVHHPCVIDAGRSIVASCGQMRRVWGPGDRERVPLMSCQSRNLFPRIHAHHLAIDIVPYDRNHMPIRTLGGKLLQGRESSVLEKKGGKKTLPREQMIPYIDKPVCRILCLLLQCSQVHTSNLFVVCRNVGM